MTLGLDNIDNALKNVYLPVIQDRLNTIDPFIASIEKTTSGVWGKEILIPIMTKAEKGNYVMFKQDLATITMPLYFSDKAIRACQTNANAFVNLVNAEVEDGIAFASKFIQDAIYDKDKHLDKDICAVKNHTPLFLNGFKALFEEPVYCGLLKTKYNIQPTTVKIKELDFEYLRLFLENENDEVNFMICSPYIRRKFEEYEMSHYRNINIVEQVNGYKCLGFTDNIIIQTYKYLPDDVIYFVNSRDFKIHQLCDWQWLESDKSKIVNKMESQPMYKATLMKYANLVCHNPEKQIKVVIEE